MDLQLYHFADAVCAQKVRIALEEKRLPWESRLVRGGGKDDLRSAEYLTLNPNGYVPTLVHEGFALAESRVINEYLEDAFPELALLPENPRQRARARLWTKQVDDSLHLNIYVLTFAIAFRESRLRMSPEALEKSLPLTNPVKRAFTLELIERGFAAPQFRFAIERFVKLLDDMETVLSQTEWLVGDDYSLADCDLTPYLVRLKRLGLFALIEDRFPNVVRWFAVIEARPSFAPAITDWFTEEDDAVARISAEKARGEATAVFDAVPNPRAGAN